MHNHAKLLTIVALSFNLIPIRTRYILVHVKGDLQGTHNDHMRESRPMVDELSSRELHCKETKIGAESDKCKETYGDAKPICDHGVCVERARTPEPDQVVTVDISNPNKRCETDDDCLDGYKCKEVGFPLRKCMEESGGGGGCFHGSNMVRLESGERKFISDLKVGESVLAVNEVGILRYSQVIIQLHADSEATTKFQVIRTKAGRHLTLTPSHLIYKAEKEIAPFKSVFAMKIRKEDSIFVFDENKGIIQDEVVSNNVETRKGLYSPVTSHGNIIVEDIVASCYSDYESHSFLHMAFGPARWLSDARNALLSMRGSGRYDTSDQQEIEMGHHWYSQALLAIGNNLIPQKLEF